jgi:hypothetical protein
LIVVAVELLPVTETTKYVNIGVAADNGCILLLVKSVKNIPGVTVPETDGLILVADNVITLPEDIDELFTIKLGFIVYAEDVNTLKLTGDPVDPLKNPLGAALLNTLSIYELSKGTPNVLPDVESIKSGYLICILFFCGTGERLCALY